MFISLLCLQSMSSAQHTTLCNVVAKEIIDVAKQTQDRTRAGQNSRDDWPHNTRTGLKYWLSIIQHRQHRQVDY